MKTFYAENIMVWHEWLVLHHLDEPEIWLIYYKKGSGKPGIQYEESVEEALCFGWVDSLVKKIDDEKYARKFTPRKSGSQWSELNIIRAQRMVEQGRMTENGLRLFEESQIRSQVNVLSRKEILEAYRMKLMESLDLDLLTLFRALAPSHQRQYAGWVMSAKKEETRQKRIEEMSVALSRGVPLGLK